MSLFDTKAAMVVRFHSKAVADGLFEKMSPEKQASIAGFVADYTASIAPDEAMARYYLLLAPIEKVFAYTRTLAKSLVSLLEAWTGPAGNADAVRVDTGPWLLGEDEAEDLERLQKFHAGFVKHFGAAGLPPQLKSDEVKRQSAAHLKARAAKPEVPPRQHLAVVNAAQRDLAAACDTAFDDYHDFLDAWFGKKGDEAFAKKAAYSFDRRAGRYRSARPEEARPPAPAPQGAAAPAAAKG